MQCKFKFFVLAVLWFVACNFGSSQNIYAQTMDLLPITIVGETSVAADDYKEISSGEYLADQSAAVDVQSRVGCGWLQDVSIRAAIFEDADVSLNGVTMNNPQTGHFNLSLPGVSYDIKQVDLDLNGQSLAFQLKEPKAGENYARTAAGSAGFFEQVVSITRKVGEGFHRFSAEGMRTDGLRDDTDGYRVAGSYMFSQKSMERDVLVYLSSSEKQFGENGAYAAPWYMREEEKIRQEFLTAELTVHDGLDFTIKPYIHRTQDTFWLDRDNPTVYRNDHTTYVAGNIFEISDPETGRFIALEAQGDYLRSTNLGERNRFFYSGEVGLKTQYYGNWNYAGSVKIKYFDTFPMEILPNIAIGYQWGNFWAMTARAERLYRQPSYTELYYISSSNQGNPDLDPQTSDNAELGIHYATDEWQFDTDVFYRHQTDTIDWVRNTGDSKFLAVNAGKVNVRGFDVGVGMKKDLILFDAFDFSYTRLDVNKEQTYDISKYVFDYLRDRFLLKLDAQRGKWSYGVKCAFEYHISLHDRWIFGAQMDYRVNHDMKIFAAAENIFDEDYEEFLDIQGEPFFVKAGIELRF